MGEITAWLPVILACAVALLLSGMVKGVLSLGLPLVGMPLLTLVVDVRIAVVTLMIPLVLSNLIQAIEGRGTLAMLKRFWPLIICLIGGTFIGTALFAALDRTAAAHRRRAGDRALHFLDPAAACDVPAPLSHGSARRWDLSPV